MNDQDNDKRRGGKAGGGNRFGDARPQGGAGKPSRPGFAGKRADAGGDKRPFKARPPRRDGDERTERPAGAREGFRGADGRDGGKPPFRPRRDDATSARRDERPDRARSAPMVDERPRSGTSGATELERIAKVMARAGLCSRREAEEWILGGRVSVNGRPIESPALDVGPKDVILVDNLPLPARERTRLWLYHKPRGLVTTADDPEGRATVFDSLPGELPRVISVGRLDINTEGLLLLTNDGGLARVLGHPTTGWLRRYRVRVHGETDQAALDELRDGISLDGVDYEPIVATLDRKKGDNAWLTMDLTEGKNREVKRVLEHLGLHVSRLIRVSFGPFHLGDMPEGSVEEVRTRMLKDQLGPRLMEEAGVDFDAPVFLATDTPSEEPRKKRYLSREGFQERRRKAVLGEDEGLKVERSAFADRKGRQVKVERIRVLRPEPEETVEEPGRHRRDSRNRPDAGARAPRQFGERPAAGRNFEERPQRSRDERSGAGRAQGDRPQGGRGFAKRPDGDRPPRRDGEDRPARAFGSRDERAPRTAGGRSFAKRPDGARPPRRDGEDRPARAFGSRDERAPRTAGGRDFAKRPDGARPPRRDSEDRPARAFGSRDERAPHTEGGRSFAKRPDGDRPPRRDRDDRAPRAAGGRDDRPPRVEGGRSFGGKPGGFKSRPGGSSGGYKGKPGGSGPRTGGKPRSGGAPRRGGG